MMRHPCSGRNRRAESSKLLADDDMAALHQADIVHIVHADDAGKHMIDPWPGGIDQQPCLDLFDLPGLQFSI